MNPIKASIERPIAVIAGVMMIVMFGWLGLVSIPIQLAPDVNKPVITVRTDWFGAAPAEVEREIVNKQEEALKGLEGLENIISRALPSRSEVTLEFTVSQNMDRALLLVANRLDRVTGYPAEAEQPTLSTAGSEDNPIAWFTLIRAQGNEREVHTYGDFVEDYVREALERVPGIAQSNAFGGSEREIEVVVLPERLASYRLTVGEVIGALRSANVSVSAGAVEEGKRRYVVRTEGEFTNGEQISATVVRSNRDSESGRFGRVTIGDIARVNETYKEPTARIRYLGQPAIAVNVVRETGANVIETMQGVRAVVDELNATILPAEGLMLRQVYDETVYINSAIDLVQNNILIGGTLAALTLLIFLRSLRATLVVSLAIPVSVIGSFVAMAALGRSINVISLAGMAFAVGMVVDAAIVVLENIFRLRQTGMPVRQAAYLGASRVWGAILVSALTTVMAFIPILIMQLEVGQLFRDIAVAISVSVMLSLVVAVTVIPALASRLLAPVGSGETRLRIPGIDHAAGGFVRLIRGFAALVVRRPLVGLVSAIAISASAVAGAWVFLPKLEYLPDGNRNFVFGVILPPPGYNLETNVGIARSVEDVVRTHWASETGPASEAGEPPKIEHFFFVTTQSNSFVGASVVDAEQDRAAELIPVLRAPVFREPGTFGFMTQPSIFGRGLGGGKSINVDISGPELETILRVALQATDQIAQILPRSQGHQFRPLPGLELGAPEVRVLPNPVRLADAGLSARDLGEAVDTFNDGLRVAEITVDGKRIDLMLRGPDNQIVETQGIGALPVVTRDGDILPVEALASIALVGGPTEIRHRERQKTITLEIRPAAGVPLEAALERLETEVIAPLKAAGLPPGVSLSLSGTADKLRETWGEMQLNLLVAIAIVFLVMAVLFESFWYPLIIMVSVPVAAAGGVAGLMILNLYIPQTLDMLTMLGFVILIGTVVNNAILLVDQSLQHRRLEGMAVHAAIEEATANRIRPIFMSSLTSIFGMMPLVVFPGAGSELYRGLGAVVLGGLALSTFVTLLLIPSLLAVFMHLIERGQAVPAGQTVPAGMPEPAVGLQKPTE